MDPSPEKFGRFRIASTAIGETILLSRAWNEDVYLAFDRVLGRLVELHVLKPGGAMVSASGLVQLAAELKSRSFMTVLVAGEEEGVSYYAANLSDGEMAEAYVARRGPLPSVTALCLMQSYLTDLASANKAQPLLARMQLANPLVTTVEDVFLTLRVVDYGMADVEEYDAGDARLVADCCRLLMLLLTGEVFAGQMLDEIPAFTCLPPNLQKALRCGLSERGAALLSLAKLRDEVTEACDLLIGKQRMDASPRHIEATGLLKPLSQIQSLLLGDRPASSFLPSEYQAANRDDATRDPFSVEAIDSKSNKPVAVHLLPPASIVDQAQYEPVPAHMWRYKVEEHPNIMPPVKRLESAGYTLLVEPREHGFEFSRLMAKRVRLPASEALAILRQVRSCLNQSQVFRESGSTDIYPSNLWVQVGKAESQQVIDVESLLHQPVGSWPTFALQMRVHKTWRSLAEPRLTEIANRSLDKDEHRAGIDLRNRSLVALAVYLLTGERLTEIKPSFDKSVPEPLAAYLLECVEAGRFANETPAPEVFVETFASHVPWQAAPAPSRTTDRIGLGEILAQAQPPSSTPDAGVDDERFRLPLTTRPLAPIEASETKRKNESGAGLIVWGTLAACIAGLYFLLFPDGGSRPIADAPVEAPPVVLAPRVNLPSKPLVALTPTFRGAGSPMEETVRTAEVVTGTADEVIDQPTPVAVVKMAPPLEPKSIVQDLAVTRPSELLKAVARPAPVFNPAAPPTSVMQSLAAAMPLPAPKPKAPKATPPATPKPVAPTLAAAAPVAPLKIDPPPAAPVAKPKPVTPTLAAAASAQPLKIDVPPPLPANPVVVKPKPVAAPSLAITAPTPPTPEKPKAKVDDQPVLTVMRAVVPSAEEIRRFKEQTATR